VDKRPAICSFYGKDKYISKMLGYSVTVVILAMNYILKILTIKLIQWVKEDTQSVQLSSITNAVFYA